MTLQNSLTVNVVRGKTVHDIALPRIQSQQGKRFEYWVATDTLCDEDRSLEQLGQPVYLSIASSRPSEFKLRVKPAANFNLEKSITTEASPSEPRYYMLLKNLLYKFPEDIEKVDVRANSDSDICGRLIVRKATCPLFDGSGLLEQSDVYFFQTFTKFAGFSIRKSDIGPEVHIAFTVNPDDSACGIAGKGPIDSENAGRDKDAQISVSPVNEQTFIFMIPLFVYAGSMILVLLLTFLKYRFLDRQKNNEPNDFEENCSGVDIIVDLSFLFDKPNRIVSHKEYQKGRLVKEAKYFNFLFFQIFGSILPALTTLFQNRQQTSNKMDFDTCYLNYKCSSEMFHLNSFNSVASVSGLAVIGILNLIIVFRRKLFCYQVPKILTTHGIQERDAPKVVCLLSFVAMGMLGIITSNCPDKSTLHLYVFNGRLFKESGEIIVFISFYSLHWVLLISLVHQRPSGLQGHQWLSNPVCGPENILSDENGVYRPLSSKLVYITAAMIYSVLCPLYTLLDSNAYISHSAIILGKGQVGIYFFYYIAQKIRFERRSFSSSFQFIGIVLITIFVFFEVIANATLAYQLNTYSVLVTPAKSRELNQECLLPGIDWNDLRNYNRAFSWFMFIVLMDYIDSNVKKIPKKNIFVF
ncbi:hypothetical protein CRE_09104 [Caenorhabditis remanei]|uniref:Uncharacterized protein n=1 Tax=Caenorhabditis remanei TaxID=31234 RepID=E3LJA7_CAERE|nr:hypothetical protein CRE_09104 [Caenorhabditis remanei]